MCLTPYLKMTYSLLKALQWKTKEAKGVITLRRGAARI